MPDYGTDIIIQKTEYLIKEILRVIKIYWFYSPKHPAIVQLINSLEQLLRPLISEGPLRLNITKDEILLGAVPLNKSNKINQEFCRYLNKRRIYNITFLPEFTESDLAGIISILSMKPKQIRQYGGIRKLINDRNVTKIVLSEYIYYSATSFMKEMRDPNTKQSDLLKRPLYTVTDEMINRFKYFIQGKLNSLEPQEEEVFMELVQDPGRLAELLNQSIPVLEKPEYSIPISKLYQEAIYQIHNWVSCRSPEEIKLIMRNLAISILEQKADRSLDILINLNALSEKEVQVIRDIVYQLSDDEIMYLVMQNISPDEACEKTLGVLKNLPLDELRYQQISEKYEYLLKRKRQQELDELELKKLLDRCGEYSYLLILSDTGRILMELTGKEEQNLLLRDILNTLERNILELLTFRNYSLCWKIIRLLKNIQTGKKEYSEEINNHAGQIIKNISSGENIAQYIHFLMEATGEEEEILVDILSHLDSSIVLPVITYLNLPSHLNIHKSLIRILERLGDEGVEEISRAITGCPENTAKELINVLGHIGTDKSVIYLKKIMEQIDLVLRPHLVRVLAELKKLENRDWFIQYYKQEKELSIRLACLEGLGQIGDEICMSIIRNRALKNLFQNESDLQMQYRSIQLLGKANDIKSIPGLIRLFRRYRWIPSKKRDQLRIMVAQTLWKMDDSSAQETVQNGCQDIRRNVRQICKSLVTTKEISISLDKRIL